MRVNGGLAVNISDTSEDEGTIGEKKMILAEIMMLRVKVEWTARMMMKMQTKLMMKTMESKATAVKVVRTLSQLLADESTKALTKIIVRRFSLNY